MPDTEPNKNTISCRHCCQPVDRNATKCHHCGEQLSTRSHAVQVTRKLMGLVGAVTAVLSLFFALKEGYFFIQERQEQRAMADSYLAAAENFIKLDSLVYAEQSLERALSANPSDQRLRAKAFFMRANHFLREADYYGMQLPDERYAVVQEMVLSGFSLLNGDISGHDRALLMLSLARLLQYDRQWQSPNGVKGLFEQALSLEPTFYDIHYWFGQWLLLSDAESDRQRGFELLQQAAEAQPHSAMYSVALADEMVKRNMYQAAFTAYRRAIESKPKQDQLQQIRASNIARTNLAYAIIGADKSSPIIGETFFGLSRQERLELVRFALAHNAQRQLRYIAAQLFYQAGLNDDAETQMREALGSYDFYSQADQLALFADILGIQKKLEEQQRVQEILARKEDRQKYEDVLESSLEGGHHYKIGLKASRDHDADGVLVVQVYEQYPFHKAGVREGDRLLEFGHRKINSLRTIINLIFDFSPGADVPLKVQRGAEVLDLTVVIE